MPKCTAVCFHKKRVQLMFIWGVANILYFCFYLYSIEYFVPLDYIFNTVYRECKTVVYRTSVIYFIYLQVHVRFSCHRQIASAIAIVIIIGTSYTFNLQNGACLHCAQFFTCLPMCTCSRSMKQEQKDTQVSYFHRIHKEKESSKQQKCNRTFQEHQGLHRAWQTHFPRDNNNL